MNFIRNVSTCNTNSIHFLKHKISAAQGAIHGEVTVVRLTADLYLASSSMSQPSQVFVEQYTLAGNPILFLHGHPSMWAFCFGALFLIIVFHPKYSRTFSSPVIFSLLDFDPNSPVYSCIEGQDLS